MIPVDRFIERNSARMRVMDDETSEESDAPSIEALSNENAALIYGDPNGPEDF